jgi:translation initiation factor 1A
MIRKEENQSLRLPLPNNRENEMFAVVEQVLGFCRMNVNCEDGKSRMARIPGAKKRRIKKIKAGDLLIISPWNVQDEKADIKFKYKRNHAKLLSRKNVLPDLVNVFEP